MPFSDQLDAVDAAVIGHLTDPALFRPLSGDPDIAVDIVFERSASGELLDRTTVVMEKPTAQVCASQVADIVRGDRLIYPLAADRSIDAGSRFWTVQGKPQRPDEGRWWICDIADSGAAS